MKATHISLVLVIATAVWLAQAPGYGQHNDRRAGTGASRSADRNKEPLLLRNLFGKRRPGTAEAPVAAPADPAVLATSTPAAPVPGEPAGVVPAQGGAAAMAAAASAGSSRISSAPVSVAAPSSTSASDSVAAAINRITGKSKGEMAASASKALEGNSEELQKLARSVEQDPSKLLEEGKKLLDDPQISASARQALEAMTKSEGKGPKVAVSSLEEVKQLAEKMVSDPALMENGKQFLAENPGLLEEGKQLLKDKQRLVEGGKAKEFLERLPEVGGQLAQIKPPVIPAPSAVPSGPLPPWVGTGVPVPKDPVVAPIPRPDVQADQVTRITAQFARFDANTNVVTFEEDVELSHQEFDLSCQVLIAELKPGKDGSQPDPTMAKAQAAAGGIRRAIAKGYVIIQKISADGKIQVAKSREAIYDAESGDVVLSDFPQLQDGNNLISGAAQTTKIYLRRNGKYEVKGLAEYELVPEGGDPLKTLQR